MEYILKSSLALTVTYLLYYVFARKNGHFKWLRAYFLVAIVVSFSLPALKYLPDFHRQNIVSVPSRYIPVWMGESMTLVASQDMTVPEVKASKSKLPLAVVLKYMYFAGVLVLLFRFLIGLLHLTWLTVKNRIRRINHDTLVIVKNLPAPFSFFQLIFIGPDDLVDTRKTAMLQHERVHVRQWHSLDLLLLELVSLVQWFNPFAWLVRRVVKEIHEYLADAGTVKGDVSPLEYQQLLLSQAFGVKSYLPANGFNNSLTKKRILMITNNKFNKKWVAIFMLSVAVIIISDSLSRVNIAQTSAAKKNSTSQSIKTQDDQKAESSLTKKTVKFTPPNVNRPPLYKGTSNEQASLRATALFLGKKLSQKDLGKNNSGKFVCIKFTVNENGKVNNVVCANNDPALPHELKEPYVTKETRRFPENGSHINEMQTSLLVTDEPVFVNTAIDIVAEIPDFEPGTDEKNTPVKKDVYTIVIFGGGVGAHKGAEISKFIDNNLTYPEKAKTNKIEGSIYVRFSIGNNGNVGNVSIIPISEAKQIYDAYNPKIKLKPTENEYLVGEVLRVFKTLPGYTTAISPSENLCNARCRIDFYSSSK
jgi:hypothetical protein